MRPLHSIRSGRNRWWTQAWAMVLAGGMVMGLALGVRHVQGLFLLPMTRDRGWTRETFALALATQNLVWGLAQPFTGMVADRCGATRVMAAGLALYALGLAGMAWAPNAAALVLTGGICIGIALSGTAFGVVYAALSRLVAPERRGWALGLAGAVAGVGQFALVPGAQGLIAGWGWAAALGVLSITATLLLPLAWPLNDRTGEICPSAEAMPLRRAVREALRTPGSGG